MKNSTTSTLALGAAALFLAACSDAVEPNPGKAGEPPASKASKETKRSDAKTTPDAKGPQMVTPEAGKIACFGANACSGQSQCNVPDGRVAPGSKGHGCAGQNSCTGKGWITLTKEECDAKGGKPL